MVPSMMGTMGGHRVAQTGGWVGGTAHLSYIMKPHEQGISIVTCRGPEDMTHRTLPLGKQPGCRMYQMPSRQLKTYLRMTTQCGYHTGKGGGLIQKAILIWEGGRSPVGVRRYTMWKGDRLLGPLQGSPGSTGWRWDPRNKYTIEATMVDLALGVVESFERSLDRDVRYDVHWM